MCDGWVPEHHRLAEWKKKLDDLDKNVCVVKLTAEYSAKDGRWMLHDVRYSKPEIRQTTRRMKLGMDWVKIDSMFKVMQKGIFEYIIYTVPGHLIRDTEKLKRAAKL